MSATKKKPRPTIDRTPTSFRVDKELLKELQHVSIDMGTTQTEAIEGAMRMLLDYHRRSSRQGKMIPTREWMEKLVQDEMRDSATTPLTAEESAMVAWILAIYRSIEKDELSEVISDMVRKKGRRLIGTPPSRSK